MEGEGMMGTGGEGDGGQKVLCRFTTRLSEQFRVPGNDLAIPASSTRYGLSQTVNALLRAVGAAEDDEDAGDGEEKGQRQ